MANQTSPSPPPPPEPEHATHVVDHAFPFQLDLDSCCAYAVPTQQRHAQNQGAACFCRRCTGGPHDFYENRVLVNGEEDCAHCGRLIAVDRALPAFVDRLCPRCDRDAREMGAVCAYCWGKLDAHRRRCLGNRHWPGF